MQFKNNLSYGSKGLALTKSFEGCRLKAYQDGGGVWTIGYGHTGPEVIRGLVITQAAAESLLKEDTRKAADAVMFNTTVTLTQNQFDALTDFTFNLGIGSFRGSTLLKLLNQGDYQGAKAQLIRWNKGKVDGKLVEVDGLTRRRKAEQDLFDRI